MQDSDIPYQWIPMVSGGPSVDAQTTGRAKHFHAMVLFAQLRELRQDHQAVEFGSSL